MTHYIRIIGTQAFQRKFEKQIREGFDLFEVLHMSATKRNMTRVVRLGKKNKFSRRPWDDLIHETASEIKGGTVEIMKRGAHLAYVHVTPGMVKKLKNKTKKPKKPTKPKKVKKKTTKKKPAKKKVKKTTKKKPRKKPKKKTTGKKKVKKAKKKPTKKVKQHSKEWMAGYKQGLIDGAKKEKRRVASKNRRDFQQRIKWRAERNKNNPAMRRFK